MKKLISQYKWTIISVILVCIAIGMPGSDVPSVGIPHIDKVVHCGMFGWVTLCFYWDCFKIGHQIPHPFYPIIGVVLFGALTEVIQIYVPGRSCDKIDLLADTIGVCLATIVARMCILKCLNKRK